MFYDFLMLFFYEKIFPTNSVVKHARYMLFSLSVDSITLKFADNISLIL